MKNLIKKLIPRSWLLAYHKTLARAASFWYGHPSRQLIVVGVTGTAGKTTTVNLIARALEAEGAKVGLMSTMNFQIGDKRWTNVTKMTMLGRGKLQQMLREMVTAGCRYVVVETSSEGIRNSRHVGIDYDAAVLTNLTPEHIESHGSFEKYQAEKEKLFAGLALAREKVIGGQVVPKLGVINLDGAWAADFWKYAVERRWGYTMKDEAAPGEGQVVKAEDIDLKADGVSFTVRGTRFNLNLPGEFNVYNALAAISVASGWGLDLNKVSTKLAEIQQMDGRMERIDSKKGFRVYVDYAHTSESLEMVYETLRGQLTAEKPENGVKREIGRLIAVLGSCGGGRDKAKRVLLGELAGKYADVVMVTNEDPYDEDPMEIIGQVAAGVERGEFKGELFKILDRRNAIAKACGLARGGDIIIITGKGNEQWLMGPRGSKIAWDDRQVVQDILGC